MPDTIQRGIDKVVSQERGDPYVLSRRINQHFPDGFKLQQLAVHIVFFSA
jgi:hypothetical protein